MRTNSDITIYNRYTKDNLERYQKTQIQDIVWENSEGMNRIKSGMMTADKVTVYIPLSRGKNTFIATRFWQAKTVKSGTFTLQPGDIIVRGLITEELSATFSPTDLKKKYDDVVTISTVDKFDLGSGALGHWRIGAS